MSTSQTFSSDPSESHHIAPHLPPEIIDRIIDYLHDSRADLCACALVCREWLVSSRFHLFYSISVDPGSSYCLRLYRAIQRSPHIALHVRELSYSHESRKLRHVDIVPKLLKFFSVLRKLEICGLSWTFLSPEIRESIRAILAYPSLVHFALNSVNFSRFEHFASLVRPHLKWLDVFSKYKPLFSSDEEDDVDDTKDLVCLWVDREVEQDMAEREPCRLEHLTIWAARETSQLIDWLPGPQTIIDISNLRAFDCVIEESEFCDSVQKLLRCSESSLEYLSLSMPRLSLLHFCVLNVAFVEYLDLTDVFGLGCHPNLQVLSLEFDLHADTTTYMTCVFSTVTLPSLRQIAFHFRLDGIKDIGDATWSDWKGVDCILNSEKFGSLRSVKILLLYSEMVQFSTRSEDLVHRKLIDHFPLLTSRRLLDVITVTNGECNYCGRCIGKM
jgi:hypothetical protein